MKRKLLCAFLFIVMLFAIMTVASSAATNYNIAVNGEQFTSDKLTIKCGDGTATLDMSGKTWVLTLDNATIDCVSAHDLTYYGYKYSAASGIRIDSISNSIAEAVEIVLKNDNKMLIENVEDTELVCGISSGTPLKITGDGTFDITVQEKSAFGNASFGIYSSADVYFDAEIYYTAGYANDIEGAVIYVDTDKYEIKANWPYKCDTASLVEGVVVVVPDYYSEIKYVIGTDKWSPRTVQISPRNYKINYNTNGGKLVADGPMTYTFKDGDLYLAPASKPYNLFLGWINDATKERIDFIPAGSIGDISVTATWSGDAAVPDDAGKGLGLTDVSNSLWSYNEIGYVLSKGYMEPVAATSFSPKASTTRADVVYALWVMEGKPVVNYAMSFKDVESDSKYVEAVRWASSEKIALGYSDTEFAPNDNVTREQFATFLYRYAVIKGAKAEAAELKFSDAAKIDAWAEEAVEWCVKNGIIIGRDDGTFDPLALCKREEAAAMIARYDALISK